MVEFIDNYDELTVPEVAERLESLDTDQLEQLREYEVGDKDRATLIDAIEEELSTRSVQTTGDEDDADEASVDESQEGDDGDSGSLDTVRLRIPGQGRYAGQWYDEAQIVEVERTLRIEEEIENNRVEVIDNE